MDNNLNITKAQYVKDPILEKNTLIQITINGQKMFVPLNPANRHYAAIMEQVETGTLTIAEAENV